MNESLDIAFVASGDPRLDTFRSVASGGTAPIHRLAEVMSAKGHDVTIYAGTHSSGGIERKTRYAIHYLPTPNLGDPIDKLIEKLPLSDYVVRPARLSSTPGEAVERLFGRLSFSKRVSGVLDKSNHDLVYYRDRLSAFYPARHAIPSVFTVVDPGACSFFYDTSIATHPANILLFRYKRAVERSVVANVDQTIVMNERTKREYQSIARDISIVTLGVKATSFNDSESRDEQQVILYVGRLDGNKRPEIVIESFEETNWNDWELHYVGSGPRLEYVRDLASLSPTADRVKFHGHLPRTQVLERMRDASIFVLPSEFENCPNVIIEAMASGCPVIASDTIGARQLINDGKTGLLFEKYDHEGLQNAMNILMQNEDRRRELARAAYEYALENHTMEVIGNKYLNVGRRAIDPHE